MSYNLVTSGAVQSLVQSVAGTLNRALGSALASANAVMNPATLASFGQVNPVASQAVDVVGVYDSDYTQVIQSARPMRVSLNESANVFVHPVESGGVVTDWRVTMPVELAMTVFIQSEDYRSVYQSIKSMYLGTDLYTIQTKSGTYPNMLLAGMPHEEDPEQFDTLGIQLHFKEAIIVTAQFQAIAQGQADTGDQSTVSRGEQPSKSLLLQGAQYFGFFKP